MAYKQSSLLAAVMLYWLCVTPSSLLCWNTSRSRLLVCCQCQSVLSTILLLHTALCIASHSFGFRVEGLSHTTLLLEFQTRLSPLECEPHNAARLETNQMDDIGAWSLLCHTNKMTESPMTANQLTLLEREERENHVKNGTCFYRKINLVDRIK